MEQEKLLTKPLINRIKVIYFSDPVCSTCWIVDPYIKKLLREYGKMIDLEVVMGGLLDDWSTLCQPTSDSETRQYLCNLWSGEEKKFDIRLDITVWETTPVRSSIPASVAYYAAAKQGNKQGDLFIRIVREMLFLRGKDISQSHHLRSAALEAGIDIQLFNEALLSGEAKDLFDQRQQLRSIWKPKYYPALIFQNSDGEWFQGMDPVGEYSLEAMYKNWEQLIGTLTQNQARKTVKTHTVLDTLKSYGRLSFSELRILTNQPDALIFNQLKKGKAIGQVIEEQIGSKKYYRNNTTPFQFNKKGIQLTDALILGGGVCGKYLGYGLKMCGVTATILERQSKDAFKGFGFIMLKNGIDAMDAMGLKNELYRIGNPINFFKAMDVQGNTLFHKELTDCLSISREAYYQIMDEVGSDLNVHYQQEGISVKQNEGEWSVSVTDQNGTVMTAEAVFAADGIQSKIRKQFFPQNELEKVDEREILGTARVEGLNLEPDTFIKIIDAENGRYMGILPLDNDEFIWFLQLNPSIHEVNHTTSSELKSFVENTIQAYPEWCHKIIQATDFSTAFYWSAHRMDLLPSFHEGNTILLGDAAHPFLALTSQGANCALEDAAFLLTLLSDKDPEESMEDIFTQFYLMRREAIQHHINEGDALLDDFLSLQKKGSFRLPLSIH
jgi:2-polyprenyl-6-methoxyphenol hydroxylase-like FAD-dependent oxidoreductase/predicted DsbA family dithiol-disulfide isomerase